MLSRYHAAALPWLYVGSAVATAALTGLGGLRRRRPPRPGVLALAGAVGAVGLMALIGLGHSSVALVLYVFAEAFATYAAISFWGSLADAFDARESKRAFTVVSGIGMGGGVAGGFLAQEVAERLGAASLVFFSAGWLLLGTMAFGWHKVQPLTSAGDRPSHGSAWTYLRVQKYGHGLLLLVLCLAVLSGLADFVFRKRAAGLLGEDQLASLFGTVLLWTSVLCVLFQLVAAEWLLRRIGILRYLAIIPVVLWGLAVWTASGKSLAPAFLLKLVEAAASLSIVPVAIQLLYAPIPDAQREGVRGVLDGAVKKGGLALAGIGLIGAGSMAGGLGPAVLVAGACVVALALLWRLRPLYVGALQERVAGNVRDGQLSEHDRHALIAALAASSADRVLNALAYLQQGGVDVRPHLGALLAHSEARVLERALGLAGELRAVEVAGKIERHLASHVRGIREQAIRSLARLSPPRAVMALPALLNEPDAAIRCAAIGALLKAGEAAGADPALEAVLPQARGALDALLARGPRAPLAERREVARLLGELGDERAGAALARYLDDSDLGVRRLAIGAVGQARLHFLLPRVLPFLASRDERRAAREALVALGDEALPQLERVLNDRSYPAALRCALPRVIRQVGTQRALEALLFSNIRDDAFLHYRIGEALGRLREARPHLVVDQKWVREALERRREVYVALVDTFRDLRGGLGDQALLTRAVGDRLDQAYELSFLLLGLLYDPDALRRAHAHVVGADARRRAWALELLEAMLAPEDVALISQQTEAHHRELPVGAAGRLAARVTELTQSDDGVLRGCARYVAVHRFGERSWQDETMPDAQLDRMFGLEGVEIFAQCDVDDLAAVAAVARTLSFKAGERIYSEGDPGDALYVILEGAAEARRAGELVLTLGSKEAFGDLSLLDGAPRPTDIVAVEALRVLAIDRRDFLDLVADRPELLKGVLRAVSGQFKRVLEAPRRPSGEVPARTTS